MSVSPASRNNNLIHDPGWNHQPDRTWLIEFLQQVRQRGSASGSFFGEVLDRFRHSIKVQRWPALMSRRTMLAPIRPSPTIPSCIGESVFMRRISVILNL